MKFQLRPFLTLLGLLMLALAMTPAWGFYRPDTLAALLAAWGLLLAACTLPDRDWPVAPSLGRWLVIAAAVGALPCQLAALATEDLDSRRLAAALVYGVLVVVALAVYLARDFAPPFRTALMAAGALLLGSAGVPAADVFTPTTPVQQLAWLIPAVIGFLTIASLTLHLAGPAARWPTLLKVQVLVLFLAGAALRIDALLAVPNPVIDVYTILRDAPEHIWNGRNPYTSSYENPYPYPLPDYEAWPVYPPLPFVFALPFWLAGLDVRYANVVCDMAAAAFLLGIARSRGGLRLGALAAGTYLLFPRASFMAEQAWYEPMLAAALGGGWWLLERGRPLGYVFLGLGLTGKQFGVALLPPLAKTLWPRRWGLLIGLVIASGLILPFYLWDRQAFLDVILFRQLRRPVMGNAMTLQNGVPALLGLSVPSWWTTGLAIGVIGWLTWRAPMRTAGAGLWLGTALLTFCLCHTQAYFNYFYLCAYLLLLGLVGLRTEWHGPETTPQPGPESVRPFVHEEGPPKHFQRFWLLSWVGLGQ